MGLKYIILELKPNCFKLGKLNNNILISRLAFNRANKLGITYNVND